MSKYNSMSLTELKAAVYDQGIIIRNANQMSAMLTQLIERKEMQLKEALENNNKGVKK